MKVRTERGSKLSLHAVAVALEPADTAPEQSALGIVIRGKSDLSAAADELKPRPKFAGANFGSLGKLASPLNATLEGSIKI